MLLMGCAAKAPAAECAPSAGAGMDAGALASADGGRLNETADPDADLEDDTADGGVRRDSGPGLAIPLDAGPPVPDVIFAGAGDLCGSACTRTADLIDLIAPDAVFTLGDNVYDRGTASEFATKYDPYWGRFKDITYPSVGNHEYGTTGATGYYDYFGASAHGPRGYYSYDLGAWHIVVINSNCTPAGGCRAGSPMETWLREDLAAHPTACTLAYWHHPRFNSGSEHGNDVTMIPVWRALYENGVEVILNGHEHIYERFGPQDPDGVADPERGIRQFIVGSGGAGHYPMGTPLANSEVRNDDTYGVLKLTLRASSYEWDFVPIAGRSFTDSGSSNCH